MLTRGDDVSMKKVIAFLLTLALLLLYVLPTQDSSVLDPLQVKFIDVGQGDAILLQCGGQSLLIDGGPAEAQQNLYKEIRTEAKLNYINYVISTHPHDDHIQGLTVAASFCEFGKVYSPIKEYDSLAFREFQQRMSKQNINIIIPETDDSFHLGSALVEFLGSVDLSQEVNDWSLVVKVTHGKNTFLFTGDATENRLLKINNNLLPADVLKAGHHGANSSNTAAIYSVVMPKYVIIEVGENNDYGHPDKEMITLLRDRRIVTYRTDKNGTVTCISDGENLEFETEKQYRRY